MNSQKGLLIVIFVVISIVILSVIGGYWLSQPVKPVTLPTVVTEVPQPSNAPGPTAISEMTSWQVFENSKISFKYSSDWKVEDKTNTLTLSIPFLPGKTVPFYVDIAEHLNKESLEEKDWAKANILTYCTGEVTKSPLIFEDFKIGEMSGVKVTASDIPPTLITKKDDKIWTFAINVGYCDGGSSVDENDPTTKAHIDTFNKILSTFQFTDSN